MIVPIVEIPVTGWNRKLPTGKDFTGWEIIKELGQGYLRGKEQISTVNLATESLYKINTILK